MQDATSRNRILESAVRAFAVHGYDGASTNQICADAGISKGLLFHYFRTKENLYIDVIEHCLDSFFAAMKAADFDSATEEDLRTLVRFYRCQADFFSRYPDHYYVLNQLNTERSDMLREFAEAKKKEFIQALNLGLRLYLSRSAIRSGVDREVVLEMLTDLMLQLQKKYMTAIQRRELPLEELTRMMEKEFLAVVDIIAYGILEKRPE